MHVILTLYNNWTLLPLYLQIMAISNTGVIVTREIQLPSLLNNEQNLMHFPKGSQRTLCSLMSNRFTQRGPPPKSSWKLWWEYSSLSADVNQLHGNNLPAVCSDPKPCSALKGCVEWQRQISVL